MIFGMSTACFFPNIYTEKTIDVMAKMGVRNTEVFFCSQSEYAIPFAQELKKRLDDNGVRAYSIHALSLQFEPQLFSPHLRARQDSLDVYKQVLEAEAELGAGVYVFHGPSNVKRARHLSIDYSYTAKCTDTLADMAKDHGIKLAWENVHWCWYSAPDFLERLLPYLNTDNLYFTLDIKQAAQADFDPSEYLSGTQGKLVNIHICDYEKTVDHGISPRLPFDGSMDFSSFKNELIKINYDNAIILEVYSYNYKDNNQLMKNFNDISCFFTD